MQDYKFRAWMCSENYKIVCYAKVKHIPDDRSILDWVYETDTIDPGATRTMKLENRAKTNIEVYQDVPGARVLWCKAKDGGIAIKHCGGDDTIRRNILMFLESYAKPLHQCIEKEDGPGVEALVEKCCRLVEQPGTEPVPSPTDAGLPTPAAPRERDALLEVECDKLKKANASLRVLVKMYQKVVAADDPFQPILQTATEALMPDL